MDDIITCYIHLDAGLDPLPRGGGPPPRPGAALRRPEVRGVDPRPRRPGAVHAHPLDGSGHPHLVGGDVPRHPQRGAAGPGAGRRQGGGPDPDPDLQSGGGPGRPLPGGRRRGGGEASVLGGGRCPAAPVGGGPAAPYGTGQLGPPALGGSVDPGAEAGTTIMSTACNCFTLCFMQ